MGIRDYFSKVRNYFVRDINASGTAEIDRYAELAFEKTQKRSWISKIFGAVGRFFGNLMYYASVATIIPAAISFYRTTPQRSAWPFRENNRNAYVIKEYFDGTRAGVIGPNQTGLFNKLIERDAKHPGNRDISNIVSAVVQEGSCRFKFRTKDNYEGEMRVQYLYQVKNQEGAKEWFWRYEKDQSKVDEVIRNVMTTTLGKVKGKEVASGIIRDEADQVIKNKDGSLANYMEFAENEARKILKRERFGVEVTNFARESINFDPASQEILVLADAEKVRAEARIIKAKSEATEAEILRQATLNTIDGYIEAGNKVSQKTNQPQRAGDFAMALHDRDNIQQVANSGGRIIYIPNSLGASGSPPVYMPVNFGDLKSKL